MVETFTSHISNSIEEKAKMYEEPTLNAEEELFYAMLQQPLNKLLIDPSASSMEHILLFSQKNSRI